jgi:hypothetical protein
MLRIPFSTIAVLTYSAIYFLLATLMEAEYANQSYPTIYIGFSMVTQLLVVAGVVVFALDVGDNLARLWRWLFPFLVFDFAFGLYFDFTIAVNPQRDEWLGSLVISLWFVAPAYYFNFRIARYGLPHQAR